MGTYDPTTIKEKVIADVLAELDASEMGIADWPKTTNTTGGAYGNGDPAFEINWVTFNVENAATDVGSLILEAEQHPLRTQFLTLNGPYTYSDAGVALPGFVGSPGSCLVKKNTAADYIVAYPRSLEFVRRMRRKQIALDKLYYAMTPDNLLFWTGLLDGATDNSRAKIYLGVFDPRVSGFWDGLTGDVLDLIAVRALVKLMPRGGDNLSAANYWRTLWSEARARINAKEMPPAPRPFGEVAA